MSLSRRSFLSQLGLAASALAVAPEELFWVKKKSIFIPAPPTVIGGIEPTTWIWKQYAVPIRITLEDLTQCEQEATAYFLEQKKQHEILKGINKSFEKYPVKLYELT